MVGTRNSYPRYMSKVNAHYERIDPRNGVRNSVPGVDSIVMCIVKVHSQRIDHRNWVSHSVSGVNPVIMRIYFAHVTGVSGMEQEGQRECLLFQGTAGRSNGRCII